MAKNKTSKWLKVGCTGCARCCIETIVPITDSDLKRLQKKTKKPADKIVRFAKPSEIDYEKDAPNWIKLKKGKRAMVLRKKNDRCQFLGDDNRCTVYSHRPMTCRTFPLSIQLYDDDTLHKVTLNRIIKDTYPLTEKRKRADVEKIGQKEDGEDEKFYKVIAAFNKKHKKAEGLDFLKFLDSTTAHKS